VQAKFPFLVYEYDINLDNKYGQLAVIDIAGNGRGRLCAVTRLLDPPQLGSRLAERPLSPSNTTNHAGSMSLPLFDRFGSVHAARLKQHGRRFPLFIFEILTSTRRLRVSGFWVALTQRTHSQRAIGVISFHGSWIF
jgi:hypothetical protein